MTHPGEAHRVSILLGESARLGHRRARRNTELARHLFERAVLVGEEVEFFAQVDLARGASAQRFEDAGKWAEAADRHEAASKLTDYPLREWALADAARCRAMAGDAAAARTLYDRLDQEAPQLQLSDEQRSLRAELRAAAAQ